MGMTASPHRRLRATAFPAALVALGLALAGCEGVKDQLGIGKNPPDEFTVVARAPLSLPPDYTLRPPTPGAPRPQETQPRDRAKAALVGAAADTRAAGASSPGERALLARAGTAGAQPDIRRVINEENALFAEDDGRFVDRLIFWQNKPPPGAVIDPTKEAQRLQEASALGNPPTTGTTPVIERRTRGLFQGVF